MIARVSAATATRLEKAAVDNGFDREEHADEGWLGFASTRAPLQIWLTALGDDLFLVTFSQAHVARVSESAGGRASSSAAREIGHARISVRRP